MWIRIKQSDGDIIWVNPECIYISANAIYLIEAGGPETWKLPYKEVQDVQVLPDETICRSMLCFDIEKAIREYRQREALETQADQTHKPSDAE